MGAQDAARCDTVRDLRTVSPAAVVRRRLQALAQSLKIVRRQKRSAARQSGGVAAFESLDDDHPAAAARAAPRRC